MNALLDNPLMKLAAKNIQKKDPFDHIGKDFEVRVAQEALREELIAKSALFSIFGDNYFGMVRLDDKSINLHVNMIDLVELNRAGKLTRDRMAFIKRGMRPAEKNDAIMPIVRIDTLQLAVDRACLKAYGTRAEMRKRDNDAKAACLIAMADQDGRYLHVPEGKEARKLYDAVQEYANENIWCQYITEEVPEPDFNSERMTLQVIVQQIVRQWNKFK